MQPREALHRQCIGVHRLYYKVSGGGGEGREKHARGEMEIQGWIGEYGHMHGLGPSVTEMGMIQAWGPRRPWGKQ